MIKDVLINIKGTQGLDGDINTIEFTTEGRYGIKADGRYYLSYNEGQMLEDADIKTQIFVNTDNSVVLRRSGTIESRMEIGRESRKSCYYRTQMGDICIGIYGESVDIDLNESGGSIKMVYTIDSDLRLISRNEVKITVKEV